MPQAIKQLESLSVSDTEYGQAKILFQKDHEEFYQAVQKHLDFPLRFLYHYSRMACEAYSRYKANKIPERIYWDTFYDITLWCENCFKSTGKYGILDYDWLSRHVECKIFRLGRLQYELAQSEWDLPDKKEPIRKGDPVFSIHIPQGEKLDIISVKQSLGQAIQFFSEQRPYICHSWLLFPGLSEVLEGNSNILQFQKLFHILMLDFDSREAECRIYPRLQDDPDMYPETTSLQRKARQYLLSGKKLGCGTGIYLHPGYQ